MTDDPLAGLELSCSFPPGPETPALIELAEELGYFRAWCYDSPALYGDVWSTLCLAAVRTDRIGLGTAVLVPSLRHPMVTAAAIAMLERLAPGRAVVAVGAGFTGRRVLGLGPMRWADVESYVDAVRGLLLGERVRWDGGVTQMIHEAGLVAERPIKVPFLLGADGPKGVELARARGLGLVSATVPHAGLAWCSLLRVGTVLADGEPFDAARVVEAVGFTASAAYHVAYEHDRGALDTMVGGSAWRKAMDALPDEERHIALHAGHMTRLTDLDRTLATAEAIRANTLTGTPERLRQVLRRLRDRGLDEVIVQPGGSDMERDLRAYAEVAGLREPATTR